VDAKCAVDVLDGDALVVAAIVRVDEELLGPVGLVLHQKLPVGPVHVQLHLVLPAHFDAGEPGVAVPVAHLHGQPMLGVVHNHSGHLGIHPPAQIKLTVIIPKDIKWNNLQAARVAEIEALSMRMVHSAHVMFKGFKRS
jgi:hypothetical protein